MGRGLTRPLCPGDEKEVGPGKAPGIGEGDGGGDQPQARARRGGEIGEEVGECGWLVSLGRRDEVGEGAG